MNILDAIICTPAPGKDFGIESGTKCGAHAREYTIVQGASNIIIDIIIMSLPIPIILGLQLSMRKKIGILVIFLTGLL